MNTDLLTLILSFMDRQPKWAGTPRDLIEALYDDFGVRIDGPCYPWLLRFEIHALAPQLAKLGVIARDSYAKPTYFLRLVRSASDYASY